MNKGDSADDCLPKFFKVYLPDDSGDDLEIPISFNSCLPKSLPKNATVRSIYGNVWKLELRKCCDDIEKYVMVDGWKRIVKDEDLKGGEFLTFEFDGSRLFNFCIYGQATCKRLGNSVKTKEIEDESDSEDDKSSADIIVIDDDDDDFELDKQDSGDRDKSSEDIVALNDDSDDNGEEDSSSEDIIVIDDDDDDDDDYDDDDDQDGENKRKSGVETERKEKGSSEVSTKSNNENDRQYLDNDMNPFFAVNLNLRRKTDLRIRAKVIKDHDLHFPEFINLINPLEKKFGKLKRKVEGHTIKGFESIIRRNQVKPTDKIICELEKEMNGLVREIKVHVIKGGSLDKAPCEST